MTPINFNHVIPYYSPITSSGGKRKRKNKSRKHKTHKNKRSKMLRTRRNLRY